MILNIIEHQDHVIKIFSHKTERNQYAIYIIRSIPCSLKKEPTTKNSHQSASHAKLKIIK